MAVKFKVPASPKRNVFEIDDFLGVDLSNIGTNIDVRRSPNAENMVRWTPGKVRKRTGYKTKIHFTDGYPKDTNRAKVSSDTWEIVDFNNNTTRRFYMYDEDKYARYIYFDMQYKGSYRVTVYYSNGGESVNRTYTGEDVTAYNYFLNQPYSYEHLNRIIITKLSFDEGDYFYIKNLRMCTDTVAEDYSEWAEMPWTPAPEDEGVYYVDTDEEAKPIYGCHIFRDGGIGKNEVVNVNRALGTSDDWDTFTLTANEEAEAYRIAEKFYSDNEDRQEGMEIFVEFEYISDKAVEMYISNGWYLSDGIPIQTLRNTNGEPVHVKTSLYAYNRWRDHSVKLYSEENAEVKIRDFSIVYEKNAKYSWSPAPEDEGNKFNLENIYNVEETNIAVIDSFTYTRQTGAGMITVYKKIGDERTLGRFCKVSMDLTAKAVKVNETEPTDKLKTITIGLSGSNQYGSSPWIDFNIEFTEHIFDKHFEFWTIAGDDDNGHDDTISYINAEFECEYDDPDDVYNCTLIGSNITIQAAEPKDAYMISNLHYIYHTGKKMYVRRGKKGVFELAYTEANQHRSMSWQMDDKLIIADGEKLYKYTAENGLRLASEDAYIPLVTIGKAPNGGGYAYEPLNMLQPGFYEQFTVDSDNSTTKKFYLSFANLDKTEVTAWVLNNDGDWIKKTENTDFTVNRKTGRLTFTTAPGTTPVTGEDNVKVLAYKTINGYRRRVTECTFGILFGVGGVSDRLFLSGNPEYQNWDFYTQQYDPTYFPDTGYSAIGSSRSAIKGYAKIDSYLATFKDEYDDSQAAFIRYGDLIENEYTNLVEPAFRLKNVLQGNGVITPYAFGYIQTEPLFLTRLGVFAITPQDLTGKEYSQSRSFYLDGQLEKEENLEDAVAVVFKNQYILALNNRLYVLDGLQATRTDQSEPYSTRQYAGFLCTNVPAYTMWVDEDALFIGTRNGKVCRFDTDIEALESYNDDGQPIYCCWETPDLDGALFYKNKTFRYFAIRMMNSLRTSVKLYTRKLASWTFVKEDRASGLYFSFEHIDFELFSFSPDTSEKVVHTKIRLKKVDKARFRVVNQRINEPFGLTNLALEYIESGNYKG